MDKNTFMKELEQALSVLQKDELKDILSEYEQHIDMKMKSGLTEEEAIADFGSLTELTEDILSAYHVRADYAAPKKKPFQGPEKAKAACIHAGEKAAEGLKSLGAFLASVLAYWKRKIRAPFVWAFGRWKKHKEKGYHMEKQEITTWIPGDVPEDREPQMQNGEKEGGGAVGGMQTGPGRLQGFGRKPDWKKRSVWKAFLNGIEAAFHLMVQAVLWGVRMMWNAGWICFSLFFAVCGVVCLYILGLFVVLLMQDYPLAGVTVGFLGAMLCAFSVAGLGLTFLWRKEKARDIRHGDSGGPDREEDSAQKTEGEQYA